MQTRPAIRTPAIRTPAILAPAIRTLAMLASASTLIGLTGCVERRIWIDTDPPGALVWLNDAQLGRTPVAVSILHDGVYDLRLEKDGFEPIVTPATVDGPIWDQVPLDFFVEILPISARSETHWRFALRVRDDSQEALAARAQLMQRSMQQSMQQDQAQQTPPPR